MVLEVIVTTVAAVFLINLAVFIYKSMVRPSNFPPGPRSVPILGSLHLLGKYPERTMLKLAAKYGNVFSLKLADKNFVCVCGFEANRDVLMNMKLTDRRVIYAFKMVKGSDPTGIIHNQHSPALVAYRELIHDYFARKFRVNCSHEKAAREGLSKVLENFENFERNEEPVPLSETLFDVGLDVILRVLFCTGIPGVYNEEYPLVMKLRKDISALATFYQEKTFLIPEIVPGLPKCVLPDSSKNFLAASESIMKYIVKRLEEHEKTFNEEVLRDLTDCFLSSKIKEEEETVKDSNPIFTKRSLLAIIYDFFIAGVENMRCVTAFAALYLAGHQKVQRKLHKEISKVLGSKGIIEPSDMIKAPYTKATVYEVFRYSNIAPNGVPRKASKSLTFHGFSIPKGTTFLLNTYSSHFQDDKWKNARDFDPENFLNEGGDFQPNEAYMPFGLGLRKCPGESLMEYFLFTYIVALVRRFEIHPETKDTKLDYDPLPGLFAAPKPQKIRLVCRT